MIKLVPVILFAFALIGCRPHKATDEKAQFVFIKIPEQIQPLDRGTKFEDPLNIVLKSERVGEVTGGGTMLSAPDAEGKKHIEWIGLDVDLSNFDTGMPILKRELLRLGAPSDTLLTYSRNGQDVEIKLQ